MEWGTLCHNSRAPTLKHGWYRVHHKLSHRCSAGIGWRTKSLNSLIQYPHHAQLKGLQLEDSFIIHQCEIHCSWLDQYTRYELWGLTKTGFRSIEIPISIDRSFILVNQKFAANPSRTSLSTANHITRAQRTRRSSKYCYYFGHPYIPALHRQICFLFPYIQSTLYAGNCCHFTLNIFLCLHILIYLYTTFLYGKYSVE